MQANAPATKSEKKHFVIKLIPPRPSFAQDMTRDEKEIMKQHAAYWKDMADRGFAIVYGPVLDPNGVYGLGILEVDIEEQVHALAADDPAIKSGLVRMEIYRMQATLRK